jgi:hypothetical protein
MNLQESTFGVIIELHIVCKVELAIMATRKQAKENMCIAIYIYIYYYITINKNTKIMYDGLDPRHTEHNLEEDHPRNIWVKFG